MRTLAITLVAAFLFLLAQQLTAAEGGLDSERRRPSQAVVAGLIECFLDRELNRVFIQIEAGLEVNSISSTIGRNLAAAVDLSQECSYLIPRLAEQVPPNICEIGNTAEARDPSVEAFRFVCTGRPDTVIWAVGKMARAVIRLGQP